MSRETYRRIGAITGLALGIGLMAGLGYVGLVPAAIFGASGCVAGAVAAERLHDRRQNKEN